MNAYPSFIVLFVSDGSDRLVFASYPFAEASRFSLLPLQSSFGALIFIIGALPSGVCLQTYPLYRFPLDHGPAVESPCALYCTLHFRFVSESVFRDPCCQATAS